MKVVVTVKIQKTEITRKKHPCDWFLNNEQYRLENRAKITPRDIPPPQKKNYHLVRESREYGLVPFFEFSLRCDNLWGYHQGLCLEFKKREKEGFGWW